MTAPLLKVEKLVKHFPVRNHLFGRQTAVVHAVDGVSFELRAGDTMALVGESGCGKSTVGRLVLRLLEATSGKVWFDGEELMQLPPERMRSKRRELQMIFQDPYSSLNPRMTVEQTLVEPLALHGLAVGRRRERAAELLELVGLAPQYLQRYPHEFSGGQRQRIGIARALAVEPRLIVCDEAVSALDVSIQAQVVNLLQDLQKRLGLAYVFIAHDLAVVKHIASHVAVMYLGQMVEYADKRSLFANPRHPYTQALLSAIPIPEPGLRRERVILQGDVPNPINPPSGCRFRTRCPHAQDRCAAEVPELRTVDGHSVACHFWESIEAPAVVATEGAANERLMRLQAAFRAA
ncbi:dipeptide ABC transporter ATP-binding protein [Polaromonas sp. YR568]|uniref:ABC transporter ATP-binding protein n=1 Tax=Polaromonas sp. YR568 TaxID=1855301 RepID=UPI003138186C